MVHAIRFHKSGGPEVLVWEEVSLGKPGPGEARIRHTAVGLNFLDIYNRSGLYPVQLPSGLGNEAAGVVEEVGPGVTDLKPGDWVVLADIDSPHASMMLNRLIGQIESIGPLPGKPQFAEIVVRPNEDLARLREVMVLKN